MSTKEIKLELEKYMEQKAEEIMLKKEFEKYEQQEMMERGLYY